MSTVITFRADDELKKQAEHIYHELGLNMTTALNMFLRATVREQTLPISLALPNSTHQAALRDLGMTEQEFDELIDNLPLVDAFPADWYDPTDDEYAEELLRLAEQREAAK